MANKVYTKDDDGNFHVVEKGEEIVSDETYYTATGAASDALADSNMASIASDNIKETHYLVASDAEDIYDSATGEKLTAGADIGSDINNISKYYSELGDVSLDSANAVALNNVKESSLVQFVDKDGNEIAANGLDKYLDNNGKIKSDGLYIKTGDGVTDIQAASQKNVDDMVDSSEEFEVGALTLKLHVGADATTNNQISVDIESMSAKTLGVDGIKVDGLDDTNALNAIETIKEALNKVSDQRSALGAVQNRLEHTIKNLDNVVENTTAAESQIRDTDMATEMVKYSNNNILAQAGQSMLAQSNQANQGVLSLLG